MKYMLRDFKYRVGAMKDDFWKSYCWWWHSYSWYERSDSQWHSKTLYCPKCDRWIWGY